MKIKYRFLAFLVIYGLLFTALSLTGCDKKKESGEVYETQTTTKDLEIDGTVSLSSTRYLFEQNFAENDVSLVYLVHPIIPYNSYVPNIGFSAGKRVIYSGSIKLLDEYLPETALAVLNKDELRLLRNSIYAKHGMIFQSDDLKAHFQQFDWYETKSNNVEAQLADVDKANIKKIQAFENAQPNPNLNKSDFISEYWGQIPLGIGSGCPEIHFNDTHTILYNNYKEDTFKGSYKIENGFLVVLVTEQYVVKEYDTQTTEYFLSNNWHWPSGVTYSDGTVVYKEPVKMVFPVGDVFSTYHLEFFYYEGQQIGSNVWWLIGYKDKPIVHIRPATDELRNAFNDFFGDKYFYGYDDNYNSGEMIALWTETPLKDFSFVSLNYDSGTGSWASAAVLYSIDEWQSEKPLLLNTNTGDGIPTRGISFRDENNRLRFFSISKDGTGDVYQLKEIPITAFG
jgi:hypothetical protein